MLNYISQPKASREQPKSTLYLKLKKRKIVKNWEPFGFLKLQSVAKYEKMKGDPFGDIEKFTKRPRKLLKCPSVKKAKRETLWDF